MAGAITLVKRKLSPIRLSGYLTKLSIDTFDILFPLRAALRLLLSKLKSFSSWISQKIGFFCLQQYLSPTQTYPIRQSCGSFVSWRWGDHISYYAFFQAIFFDIFKATKVDLFLHMTINIFRNRVKFWEGQLDAIIFCQS